MKASSMDVLFVPSKVKPKLSPRFVFPALTGKYSVVSNLSFEDVLDAEFLAKLSSLVDLNYLRIFECPPNSSGVFHIDGDYRDTTPRGALNFVLDSYSSWRMDWFHYYGDYVLVDSPYGPKGKGQRTKLNEDQAVLRGSHSFVDLTVVRTDIPHKVVNYGTGTRLCVTLRSKDQKFEPLAEALVELQAKELASSSCLVQTGHEHLL